MINELYEKYTMRNIPNKFSIDEIDTILKDEYRVTEIEKGKIRIQTLKRWKSVTRLNTRMF
ncbi:hypothetical protein [Bacillus cereus]|nr:hypothetical protein [Bacillus cereus]AJI26020.1 hypothetical protein BF28_5700 [Bacillus cereus E33L]